MRGDSGAGDTMGRGDTVRASCRTAEAFRLESGHESSVQLDIVVRSTWLDRWWRDMRRNSLAACVGLALLWGAAEAASAAGEPRGFLRIDADDPLDSLRDTSLALQDIG